MDRQDIDALLIGALYGELTPAEQVQLTAHLESHPGDRQALDDLTAARTAVRDSRFLVGQVEPPQAVSALLLQEAARRAPRMVRRDEGEREGWFQRLRRSFIAHPAMATAAMMVLVVGVAGSMYLRNSNKSAGFSEVAVSSDRIATAEAASDQGVAPAAAPAMIKLSAPSGAAAAAGSGAAVDNFQAGLADPSASIGGKARLETAKDTGTTRSRGTKEADESRDGLGFAQQQAVTGAVEHRPQRDVANNAYVVVNGDAPTIKDAPADERRLAKAPPVAYAKKGKPSSGGDLDDAEAAYGPILGGGKSATVAHGNASAPGAAGGAGVAAAQAQAPSKPSPAPQHASVAPTTPAVQPPPPPPAVVAPSDKIARPDKTDKADASKAKNEEQKSDDSLLAWAKDRHAQLVALVRGGKCTDAATAALEIANRAPDYYAANVATDRNIKQCLAYINDVRDKDAERSGKARAKRVSPAESPAPSNLDMK